MSAARTVVGVPDDPSALLLDTFVELADTLATGYEVGGFLQFLVDRCSGLLLADTAGVLLETPEGTSRWPPPRRRRCWRSRTWR
jgi:hypothetical protein